VDARRRPQHRAAQGRRRLSAAAAGAVDCARGAATRRRRSDSLRGVGAAGARGRAARRAGAATAARRDRGARRDPRRRQARGPRGGGGAAAEPDPLGPAGLRQDHARARALAEPLAALFVALQRRARRRGRGRARSSPRRARRAPTRARGTILFVDEIHRFNKAQQDAFLPHVENGTITLIGATTENPSFSSTRRSCRAAWSSGCAARRRRSGALLERAIATRGLRRRGQAEAEALVDPRHSSRRATRGARSPARGGGRAGAP
jgi:hypothetical protein